MILNFSVREPCHRPPPPPPRTTFLYQLEHILVHGGTTRLFLITFEYVRLCSEGKIERKCSVFSKGVVPPTLNLHNVDSEEEFSMNYVALTSQQFHSPEPRTALTNSFGFGGTNASLCFRQFVPSWKSPESFRWWYYPIRHKCVKKLFLEVSKMSQVESPRKKRKKREGKDCSDCAGCVLVRNVIL